MNSRAPCRLVQRLWPLAAQRHSHRALPRASQCRLISDKPTSVPKTPHNAVNGNTASKSPSSWRKASPIIIVAAAGLVFTVASLRTPQTSFYAPGLDLADTESASDEQDLELPRFRISEIRKHDANSESPWVIHQDKVYDITNWIDAHPGGHVILRAAGGSIEPYWDLFTIHKTQYIYDILAQYQVGFVHEDDLVDGKPSNQEIEDPFAKDPERHRSLIVKTPKPCNAETPGEALDGHFLTPNDLFYVRNHFWVPEVEDGGSQHILTIERIDGTIKEYTLRDLKSKFPTHTVTAVLQCSGNRRKHMSDDSGRPTKGLPWTAGAISNASWEGVRLSDVLADAGLDITSALTGTSETKHVHFSALEAYGASIPIKKAMDPQGDVLLAFSMNGKPLPPDHGFPLRAIVPGHVAARSVKWLSHIGLSDEESPSQWQRRDYKCFGPNQTEVDWESAPSIQELPVQSAITTIKVGDWMRGTTTESLNQGQPKLETPRRQISLGGYAYSGGGRSIIRVDVSLDDGRTWTQATLLPDPTTRDVSSASNPDRNTWTWKRWRFEGTIPEEAFTLAPADAQSAAPVKDGEGAELARRCTKIVVKATDEVYNTQPESHAATWNIRGNLATAWHRVQVCTDCASGLVKQL
ncbi:Sulfite oxidase [Paramyrothecium foliicola]|nr:Sulfite oxidase [Paramyrothecium foliicola]